MLLGYDYGLAVSFSGGESWYHPDDMPLAQFYAVGVDMDYPYNVYGGTQDFGTWKGPGTKKGRFPIRLEDWEHVLGGDGFYSQADPADSRWLYVESQKWRYIKKRPENRNKNSDQVPGPGSALQLECSYPYFSS